MDSEKNNHAKRKKWHIVVLDCENAVHIHLLFNFFCFPNQLFSKSETVICHFD
jgi:hypothetical protein